METYNINISLLAVNVAKVRINLGDDIRQYQEMWLALSNHKRMTSEFVSLRNFYGSNEVEVVLDIEYSSLEKARKFCSQFGEVLSCRQSVALVQECDELYTDEYGDLDIYIA